MRSKLLLAVVAAVAACPAAAADMDYGWCETETGPPDYQMSDLLQKPDGMSSDVVKDAFKAAIGTDRRIECWFYYSSPSDAKSHFGQRQYVMKTQEQKSVTLTGWTGSWGITGEPAAKPSGAYLTVESTKASPSNAPAKPAAPAKPKKTNAQADAEYAAAMAEYHRKVAEQNAEHQAALDAVEQRKAAQRAAAGQALAAYQDQLRAHEQQVANQALDYQKMVTKPAEAPNAIFMAFPASNCDLARRSATMGAGTSSGTRFKEVAVKTNADGSCTVQGWRWSVDNGGTATRQ